MLLFSLVGARLILTIGIDDITIYCVHYRYVRKIVCTRCLHSIHGSTVFKLKK